MSAVMKVLLKNVIFYSNFYLQNDKIDTKFKLLRRTKNFEVTAPPSVKIIKASKPRVDSFRF